MTEKTKEQRLAFAQGNIHRGWRRVMIAGRSKFHFRLPGTKIHRTRWFQRSKRHEATAFKPNGPEVYNVYGGAASPSSPASPEHQENTLASKLHLDMLHADTQMKSHYLRWHTATTLSAAPSSRWLQDARACTSRLRSAARSCKQRGC